MVGFKSAVIVAASLLALAGCTRSAPPAADAAADEAAIRAVSPAWASAYNAGDAEALVALYAEDAVVSAPGVPAARGHTAIREFFVKDLAATAGSTFNLSTTDVGVSGDLGWESGTFTASDKSGTTVDTGKYLSVLEKRNGKWLLIQDIWNSDAAPAAPAPASTQ